MKKYEEIIAQEVSQLLKQKLNANIKAESVIVSETRKDIAGDFSVVLFPLAKQLGKSPQELANTLQDLEQNQIFEKVEFLKGFLNITIDSNNWFSYLKETEVNGLNKLFNKKNSEKIVIEFSSPNTNKPQHLGHIRNNLLGESISRILKQAGYNMVKLNLINDRGIHICKSILAWMKWGEGKTPETTGIKGDHLVGDFYVMFEKEYKKQVDELIKQGLAKQEAEKKAPILLEAQEILRKWEAGDTEIIKIWKMMNSWVLDGFEKTYKELGIEFDKIYFESETYLLGKKIILEQLEKGVVQKAEDGSVYIDLKEDKLDKKILLRSDGTSVYITQDIGNAVLRHDTYNFDKHIYVVADEQIYHFKVLRHTLKRFGYDWWDKIVHFSYGMVELPEGKMKSREGKVVDADDLIEEMYETARNITEEQGKLGQLDKDEKEKIIKSIGLAALKFYILNVDPKRTVLFNPQKSIDFQGKTGPFVQYSYARIQSILRKAKEQNIDYSNPAPGNINHREIELIKTIYFYPKTVYSAAKEMNPSLISNFAYNLAKDFNSYYHDFPILKEENIETRNFRLMLADIIGQVIAHALDLLGIDAPPRM